MSDPQNVALFGHRHQLIVRNTTSGSEVVADRVQTFDANFDSRFEKAYELGRVAPVGVTQGPPEFRLSWQKNLTDSIDDELILANIFPNPALAQRYTLGDLLSNASRLRTFLLTRNQAGTIQSEQVYDTGSVESIEIAWQADGAMTMTWNIVATNGQSFTSGSYHVAFAALDETSLGVIHSKDARVWLTSGSVANDRQFRLQSFRIRASFPSQFVKEIGRRSNVGTLTDVADVTVEMDFLHADDQPTEVFYSVVNGAYDYQNPITTPINARIRVFDPRLGEGVSVLRMFLVENLVATSHQPIRAQVRGLSTKRYTLTSQRETTANSGGLVVSNRNDL